MVFNNLWSLITYVFAWQWTIKNQLDDKSFKLILFGKTEAISEHKC